MDEELSFLNPKPPHWAANGLAYLILVVFALAAVASVAVQVPETVNSSFVLVPTKGTDPVRASRSGIVAKVRVTEGQSVQKGEQLFVIQSSPIGDRSSELSGLTTQLKGAGESLANVGKEYESQRQADNEEGRRLNEKISSLNQTIKLKQEQLARARQLTQRYEEGRRQGVTSEVELIRFQIDSDKSALELEESVKDRNEAETSLEKLHHESEARSARQRELERSLKELMEKSRIRMAALRRELIHSESDELSVPAPCSGTVLRLVVKAAEAFVNEGAPLSELACSGETLQAELALPQSAAARIRAGQGVKLLYEAFPYQRYGVRYGTIRWMSPAAVTSEGGAGFLGFADIGHDPIVVDGQPRPLRPGMRGTAKVVVGKRSIITYAFEPLRQLKESVSDVPTGSAKPEAAP